MKKLTLDLDALRVETFEPLPAERRESGTVRGYIYNSESLEPASEFCQQPSQFGTCEASCYGTCGYSCDDTCRARATCGCWPPE